MLNNTTTFDIDEDALEIIPKPTLDIEKIDVANILNIDKWNNNDDKYLTFSKGRKKISDYFISFIGCTAYTNAKDLNNNLRSGLNNYIEDNNLNSDEAQKLKMDAYSFLKTKSSRKQEIVLDEFANHIFPEEPKKFTDFLHEKNYEISSSFKCEMDSYRSFKFITYQSRDLNFRFSKSLIDRGLVELDKDNSQIIIKVNQAVIDQFKD